MVCQIGQPLSGDGSDFGQNRPNDTYVGLAITGVVIVGLFAFTTGCCSPAVTR